MTFGNFPFVVFLLSVRYVHISLLLLHVQYGLQARVVCGNRQADVLLFRQAQGENQLTTVQFVVQGFVLILLTIRLCIV